MNLSRTQYIFSLGILRLVGYGLLLMAGINLIFLLIPPQFMNPNWEFETMGGIVESLPVVLLGIVLIFYGENSDRSKIETIFLKWLSRFCLFGGIFLLLTIPLNINSSFRIYYQHKTKLSMETIPKIEILDRFKDKLEMANSREEVEKVLQQQTKKPIKLKDSVNTEELTQNIIKDLQTSQNSMRSKVAKLGSKRRLSLMKQSLKWNMGALISAILLFLIWKSTFWARISI